MNTTHSALNPFIKPKEAESKHSNFALDRVQQNPEQLRIALEINISP